MIQFSEVVKQFHGQTVLQGLSFSAEAGKVTGLLGRNGAGKTTALRILVGLERADQGTALFDGQRYDQLPPGEVGVGLAPHFTPTRTVMQQLSVTARAFGASRDAVLQTLEETELTEVAKKRCFGLSMGMRQRLLMACATVANPKVLVLDEPVNGLDPDGIAWLHAYLRAQAARGAAVLVSTHYLSDLSA